MKTRLTATCILIGFVALFDNSTAGKQLTQEEIDAIVKLIRILFDETLKIDVANVANIDWKKTDWTINKEGAKAKYKILVESPFGISDSGFKDLFESEDKYIGKFVEIFPDDTEYKIEAIVETIKNSEIDQMIGLRTLLFAIFCGKGFQMDLSKYEVLVRIILGMQDLTPDILDSLRIIWVNLNTNLSADATLKAKAELSGDEKVVLRDFEKIESEKQLAAYCRGDATTFLNA